MRLWPCLILVLILTGCRTPQRKLSQPPLPPGAAQALRAAIPAPPPQPQVVVPGFRITNITVQGTTTTVQWQEAPGPVMVQQAKIINGIWSNLGDANAAGMKQFAAGKQGYIRLQSWPTLHILTNQPRLTWDPIDVMPTDYIAKWRIERGAGATEPTWNPPSDVVATPDQILTIAASSLKVIPSPGNQQTFTVNEDITWVTPANAAQNDNGDYFNLEGKGQFRVVGKTNSTKQLVMEYLPLSQAPGNTHVGESASTDDQFGIASYRDGTDPSTQPGQKLWYRNWAFKASDTGMTDPIKQNVVSLSGTAPGILVWVRSANTPPSNSSITSFTVAKDTAVDSVNNIYVVGFYANDPDFGDGPVPSKTDRSIFIAKYTSANVLVWKKLFSGSSACTAFACVTDSANNVYVAGLMAGVIDFGGGGRGWAGSSVFLVKYNAAGDHQWSKAFQGGVNFESGVALSIDATGQNLFLTTAVGGSIDFGGTLVTSGGGSYYNPAVVKLSTSDGSTVWAVGDSSLPADPRGWGIAVNKFGNVAITGDWNSQSRIYMKGFAGSNGALQWTQTPTGTITFSYGTSVAADPVTGYFIFAGRYTMSASGIPGPDFGGGAVPSILGTRGMFMVAYGLDGTWKWNKNWTGTSGNDLCLVNGVLGFTGLSAAVDWVRDGNYKNGNGFFISLFSLPTAANPPVWMWAKHASGNNQSAGNAIAFDTLNRVVSAGQFLGTTDFGGTSLTANALSDSFFAASYSR